MNKLVHIDEFRDVLKSYHVSKTGEQILLDTQIVLLLGPTAGGRNTIINKLVASGAYYFVISDTTRAPRKNNGILEQNGVEYWFRDEDTMLKDLQNGAYLEAEIIHNQQVSGMSIRELTLAHNAHKVALADVDIGGVMNIRKIKPDTIVILVLPPSFKEWHRRIISRSKIHSDDYKHRLETALKIFEAGLSDSSMYAVVNDSIDEAVQSIEQIVTAKHSNNERSERARKLLQDLSNDARLELQKN